MPHLLEQLVLLPERLEVERVGLLQRKVAADVDPGLLISLKCSSERRAVVSAPVVEIAADEEDVVVGHERAVAAADVGLEHGREAVVERGLGLEDLDEVLVALLAVRLAGGEVAIDEADGTVVAHETSENSALRITQDELGAASAAHLVAIAAAEASLDRGDGDVAQTASLGRLDEDAGEELRSTSDLCRNVSHRRTPTRFSACRTVYGQSGGMCRRTAWTR